MQSDGMAGAVQKVTIASMVEVSALKDSYLVAGLTDEQVGKIASLSTVKTYRSGDTIVKSGDPATELLVVLSGSLNVTSDDNDLLGEIGVNSVVGEMGLMDGRASTANVCSVGHVSVASIPTKELRGLMNSNRDWGFLVLANIGRVMSDRLRRSNARIDELCDSTHQPWENALG